MTDLEEKVSRLRAPVTSTRTSNSSVASIMTLLTSGTVAGTPGFSGLHAPLPVADTLGVPGCETAVAGQFGSVLGGLLLGRPVLSSQVQ